MTDAIGLRNIHILNLPIQTYMYLSKLYSIEYGLFVNSYTCLRFIGGKVVQIVLKHAWESWVC